MNSSSVPTLETPRLLLRPWRDADLEPYLAMRADPEVSRYLGDGRPQTAAEARAGLEWGLGKWARLGLGRWAVEERASGAFIGYCGLLFWHEGQPDEAGELGYGYARAAWGRGYATEAAGAAVRWAFQERGFRELVATTHPANLASQRVLSKLGFVAAGETDGLYHRMNSYRLSYRLAREAFAVRAERPRVASD